LHREAIQRRFDDLDYLHDIGELDLNISFATRQYVPTISLSGATHHSVSPRATTPHSAHGETPLAGVG
jgi:hypothetical protein